jgi:hypothetical protein
MRVRKIVLDQICYGDDSDRGNASPPPKADGLARTGLPLSSTLSLKGGENGWLDSGFRRNGIRNVDSGLRGNDSGARILTVVCSLRMALRQAQGERMEVDYHGRQVKIIIYWLAEGRIKR